MAIRPTDCIFNILKYIVLMAAEIDRSNQLMQTWGFHEPVMGLILCTAHFFGKYLDLNATRSFGQFLMLDYGSTASMQAKSYLTSHSP